jgi:Fe-S-cluster-containing hydrogenase component 2
MILVNYEDCRGCGDCLDVCSLGAIHLQNEKATIDQDLCEECCACIETCPYGAIIVADEEPLPEQFIMVPEAMPGDVVPAPSQVESQPLRSIVFPAIGSMLLWTGREILPRIADIALNYLDQRLSSTEQGANQPNSQMRRQRASTPGGGRRRGVRQRRKRRRQSWRR